MVGLIEWEVDENLKVSFDEIHKTLFFERKESEEPKRYKISVASYGDFKRDIKNLLDKKDIKDIIEKSLKSGLGKKDDKEIDKFNGVFSEFLFWFYLYLEENKNGLGEYSGLVNSCLGLFNSISPEIAWRVYFKDMSVGNKIEILKKNLEILKKNLEKRYLYWWTYKTLADVCIEELEKITHPVFKLKLRAQSYKQNKDELIENVNEYIRMIISEPRKSEMEKYFSWFGRSSEDEVERVITKTGKMVRDFYNQVDLIAEVRDWFLSRYNLESVSIVEGRTFKKSSYRGFILFMLLYIAFIAFFYLFLKILECVNRLGTSIKFDELPKILLDNPLLFSVLFLPVIIFIILCIYYHYIWLFLKKFFIRNFQSTLIKDIKDIWRLFRSKNIFVGCLVGCVTLWIEFKFVKNNELIKHWLIFALLVVFSFFLLIIFIEIPSYIRVRAFKRVLLAVFISFGISGFVNLIVWPITVYTATKYDINLNNTDDLEKLFLVMVLSTVLFGVIIRQLKERRPLFVDRYREKI